MCGITGFIENINTKADKTSITLMTNSLSKRGPDYQSYFIDKNYAIGHARLSIIDLSPQSNQPVKSKSGRFIISFNGEIYNFKKLQKNIDLDYNQKMSDTLTLLQYIDLFGIEKTLNNIKGMFAFALIDKKENTLTLARDIAGEKPLYYGYIEKNHSKSFVFGSQLSSLSKHKNWNNEINKDSLNFFLKLGFIPGENSIYKNIKKINPGSYLSINISNSEILFNKKWYKKEKILINNNNSFKNVKTDLKNKLNSTIVESSVSDVPLGAHLSGGIDSTLVCSILAKNNINFETFTIGYNESDYDESKYAESISNYLNIKNNKLIINDNILINTVEKLSNVYDEPFADSSQIPSTILSNYASSKVKVMITGDGADELFGGYNRHIYLSKILRMNTFKRNFFKLLLYNFFLFNDFKVSNKLMNLLLNKFFSNPLDKINKFKRIIDNKDFIKSYVDLLGYNKLDLNTYSGLKEIINNFDLKNKNIFDKILEIDFNLYLPDDILIKSDKSSMYFGLENRSPYLNKDIIEFSKTIPLDFKIHKNKGKILLRSILADYIPKKLFERPKQGFAIPLGKMLKTSLYSWAENLLNLDTVETLSDTRRIMKDTLVNKKYLSIEDEKRIWNLLMFQSWYNKIINEIR